MAARDQAIGRRQTRDIPAAKALLTIRGVNLYSGYSKPFCRAWQTPLRQRMIEDSERAEDISARKKLIYAMSLKADRPINRAMVAGCTISATRNYFKLHMPKTLNPLLSNLHAKTQSGGILRCGSPPLSTPCPVRQPPVDALRVPDEIPTALNSHIASRWRHAFHRGRRQHANRRKHDTQGAHRRPIARMRCTDCRAGQVRFPIKGCRVTWGRRAAGCERPSIPVHCPRQRDILHGAAVAWGTGVLISRLLCRRLESPLDGGVR